MANQIDIVLPWVNGSDPDWIKRFNEYSVNGGDSNKIRFRDWDLLRYWFRSIEKFMPWVGRIHFITSGELPEWLNTDHPQLHWVKHQDYIPHEFLPTFSSHTIELNIHRIESLSENFIYFNDDFFIIKPLSPSRFFKNNLPCDYGVMTAKPASGGIIHIAINNLDILDRNFEKQKVMRKNFCKWFSPKYGTKVLNNILLYPWTEFSGFIDPHIPYSFLKSTFSEIWKAEPVELKKTCNGKFRTNDDVNQWLVRYWQLGEGNFYPKNIKKNTLCIDITDSTCRQICDMIGEQKLEILCINDSSDVTDFEKCKFDIQQSFEKILPDKSAFEKF